VVVAKEAAAMTLPEFLLARIAEDEAVARRNWDELPVQAWSLNDDEGFASVCIAAPRVLAECEAKRRIIMWHGDRNDCWFNSHGDPCDHLTALALPYADHPDFRSEWKP
jgi:hypothetical protein